MTPEVLTLLIVQVCATIVTVAGLYFKHVADMSEYRRTNSRVTKVQETLENGITHSLQDTNEKVTAMDERATARAAKELDNV